MTHTFPSLKDLKNCCKVEPASQFIYIVVIHFTEGLMQRGRIQPKNDATMEKLTKGQERNTYELLIKNKKRELLMSCHGCYVWWWEATDFLSRKSDFRGHPSWLFQLGNPNFPVQMGCSITYTAILTAFFAPACSNCIGHNVFINMSYTSFNSASLRTAWLHLVIDCLLVTAWFVIFPSLHVK